MSRVCEKRSGGGFICEAVMPLFLRHTHPGPDLRPAAMRSCPLDKDKMIESQAKNADMKKDAANWAKHLTVQHKIRYDLKVGPNG